MPHGLSIDGHDNVWLTDVALQQVYKFSPEGELLLTIGERGVAGNDERHFNRPTAVAVAGDGSFYVSDGYRNSRVIKFSADGKFLFQWGTKGSGPGQFDLPHWVALDAAGRVYVADRENQRIQVFDSAGHYLAQWAGEQFGRPYAITVDRSGKAYVADGGDQPDGPPDRSAWVLSGSDGTPLIRVGRFGNNDGQFEMAHSIAVDAEGSVYVGDITGARVQKFVPNSPSEIRAGAAP
jgi:DNA-binding beta-propeller fold protein YncE